MPDLVTSMLTLGSGAIVGVVLGLVGGGGSILAVPPCDRRRSLRRGKGLLASGSNGMRGKWR